MSQAPTQAAHSSVRSNLASFERHLRAENKAPATISTHAKAVDQSADYLAAPGMRDGICEPRREHVEAFLVDLQAAARPATVAQRFRSLEQFWKWLAEEGEIAETPMARMSAPAVPLDPPAVLPENDLRQVRAATFSADRDPRCWASAIEPGGPPVPSDGLRAQCEPSIVRGSGRR